MKTKEIIVEMDDREPTATLARADILNMETKEQLILERKRLKVGDFIYKPLSICIERKEINDFCGSIIDGRLKSQIEKMKANYKNNYVIIVGNMKDRTSEINTNCLLGKMVSLIIKDEMKLLYCNDEFELLYIIKSIIKKVGELEGGTK